jgi:hypothetical protein
VKVDSTETGGGEAEDDCAVGATGVGATGAAWGVGESTSTSTSTSTSISGGSGSGSGSGSSVIAVAVAMPLAALHAHLALAVPRIVHAHHKRVVGAVIAGAGDGGHHESELIAFFSGALGGVTAG